MDSAQVRSGYTPITHTERWIPGIFALVYLGLAGLVVAGVSPKKETPKTVVSGSLDVNIKPPVIELPTHQTSEKTAPAQKPAAAQIRREVALA